VKSPSKTFEVWSSEKDGVTVNQLNERDMQLHVSILGWLFVLGNGIVLSVGLMGFLFFAGIGTVGAANGDPQALFILGLIGIIGLLLFAVLTVPGLLAGYGLLTRRSWSRVLAVVMGVLGMINIPVGTLIGAYALWVLFQEAATGYFMPAQPAQ
jgi:hypothetical protein